MIIIITIIIIIIIVIIIIIISLQKMGIAKFIKTTQFTIFDTERINSYEMYEKDVQYSNYSIVNWKTISVNICNMH